MPSYEPTYFSRSELECRCGCGQCWMDDKYLEALDQLRTDCGFPLPVSSGFRCRPHNADVGGSPTSYHTDRVAPNTRFGQAVDIHVTGKYAAKLVAAAVAAGFKEIGISMKGDWRGRFIHIGGIPDIEGTVDFYSYK